MQENDLCPFPNTLSFINDDGESSMVAYQGKESPDADTGQGPRSYPQQLEIAKVVEEASSHRLGSSRHYRVDAGLQTYQLGGCLGEVGSRESILPLA